jgi:potassium efflux system protein
MRCLVLATIALAFAERHLISGEAPPDEVVTRELVENRLKEAEDSKDLADETKAIIRELYQQSLQDLDVATNLAAQAVAFDEMATDVEGKIAEIKEKLGAVPSGVVVDVREGMALAEVEKLLKDEEAALGKVKQEATRLEAEPARRQTRRSEIPNAATAIRERLGQAEQQLAAPAPADDPSLLTTARQLRWRVQRQALKQELATGDKESAAYAAEAAELLPLKRDLSARLAGQAEARVAKLREIANRLRQAEAEQLAATARLEAARAHPLLQPEAQRNQDLATQSQQLAPRIQATSLDLEKTTQELDRVKGEFQTTQEKVDKGGMTEGVGLLMRRQLKTLPDVRQHRRRLQIVRGDMRAAELSLIDLDDERYALGDTERAVERKLAELGPLPPDVVAADLRSALRDLLELRKGFLDKLIQSQDSHFDTLVKLDSVESDLIREVVAFNEYLRERVLWIRSARVMQPADLKPASEALLWLLRPNNWIDAAWAVAPYGQRIRTLQNDPAVDTSTKFFSALGTETASRPWPLLVSLPFTVLFVILLVYQRRLRARIRQSGEQAARRNCQQFQPTIQAFVHTGLVSLQWPVLFLFLAWRLTTAVGASDFARAAGFGLGISGAYYLSFEFLRQLCRYRGLAEAHFDWPVEIHTLLRRYVRVLLVITAPIVFVVGTLHGQSNESWQNSLARALCIAALIVVSVIVHRVFRPRGDFFQAILGAAPDSWFCQLRRLWHGLIVASLLALVALACIGYYYTAHQLVFRLQQTFWLLLLLMVLAFLVRRWLLVNRRRLAIEQALERRRAAQAQAATAEHGPIQHTATFVADSELDLGEMSLQSRKLLNVSLFIAGILGMWYIWIDVLPALGILEGVRLWSVSDRGALRWITLENLFLALMILVVMFLAIRNIPGLLELTLLQRLPLDAGARYAITTCFRYLITIIGVVFAFRTVGIEWSQYQWLVAAATVGLGFGLQEIFANFVSGLIVLMERPVRVGDVVTVEGVSGVVSRIRMRATTVTNWDRQEFIVPNKEFVTGRLLNWTLSNSTNRIIINVGVAYGSDIDLVTEILLKIASENQNVLGDPEPVVTFEMFGDSTLNFSMRCYLPNIDNRLATIHELNCQIDHHFAEAGIEIAFPQRDVHVRSVVPQLVVDDRRPPAERQG